MNPKTSMLAHNWTRIVDFSTYRLVFDATLRSPITTNAWNDFITGALTTFNIESPFTPLEALGDIARTSICAVLNAVAYDGLFTPTHFAEQFIRSYVPSAQRRAEFIGAHQTRLRRFLLLGHKSAAAGSITDSVCDLITHDVIRHELITISQLLLEISTNLTTLETIDEDVYQARYRQPTQNHFHE